MRRALHLVPLFAVAATALAVRLGWLGGGRTAAVAVAVEVAALALGTISLVRAMRRYKRGRSGGIDGWTAFEDGLAAVAPRRVARVVIGEVRAWTCLAAWLVRRAQPVDSFGYARRSRTGPMLLLVLVTMPVELLLVELLLPWPWLRLLLLALALYGLLWLLSFHASMRTLPHRLDRDVARIRYGLLAEGRIPYVDIAAVAHEPRPTPEGRDGPRSRRSEDETSMGVGGRTDITLALRRPIGVTGLFRDTPPARTWRIAADDPDAMAAALRARLTMERG